MRGTSGEIPDLRLVCGVVGGAGVRRTILEKALISAVFQASLNLLPHLLPHMNLRQFRKITNSQILGALSATSPENCPLPYQLPKSPCLSKRGHMTVLEQVRKFVARLSPDAVCDDCISDKLSLSARQHVNLKTSELAGTQGFERHKGNCSICLNEKLVLRLT